MPNTDTCYWPRCRRLAAYTYSAAIPTVALCAKHLAALLDNKPYGYGMLHLSRKPAAPPAPAITDWDLQETNDEADNH